MGDIVDLAEKRREREAEKDRSSYKLPLPRPAPLIDRDWDEDAGRHVETVYADWSRPIYPEIKDD